MRTLRAVLAAALSVVLLVGLAACTGGEVAATVNGEDIMKAELDEQVEKLQEQYPQMFEGADAEARLLDFQQRLLDNMINGVLIRQAAEEMGIDVSDSDVDEQIEELKAGFETEEQFDEALAQAGMDMDALRTQIEDQLLTEALLEELNSDTEVAEEEITAYYAANTAQFQEEAAVNASHILFNPDDKATAEEVLVQVNEGGDFAALAKEHSQDPVSAENGGDLGWPTTPYVPEFQAAADKLEIGEISGLVETTYGWHIIKLNDRRDSRQKELDEVRDQIEQIILQQLNADSYQEFLNELRDEAEIVILIEGLELDPEGGMADPTAEPAPEEEQPEE
jgi:parvulin-like peptidyl-prolyl isomerase